MLPDNHGEKRSSGTEALFGWKLFLLDKRKVYRKYFSSEFQSGMPPRPLHPALSLSLKKTFDLLCLST